MLSKQLESVFKINFLVDTGSPTTLLSWNEVPYATLRTNLREDRIYTECSLFFYANTGIYDLVVGDLGLSNYLTVDGRQCPPVASVLGIDILNKFSISFSDDLEMLILIQSAR